ncbi:MAG: NUDIX domain-containing protein [Planctomycetes bacterium]|nr:NUDIX domain-containing protein [Planctomycetota bacterium]
MSAKPFGLAMKAFIYDEEGRCLLIRRSMNSKFFAGQWDLPGGKVDSGEEFDDAMAREVAEETGLTITLEGVAGASEHELPHIRVAILFMEARVASGDVQLSSEHDEFRWVSRKELGNMDISDQLSPFVLSYLESSNKSQIISDERGHG